LGSDCGTGGLDLGAAAQALTPEELQTLASTFSTVSPDGTVAFSTINFVTDAEGSPTVTSADAESIYEAIDQVRSDSLSIGVQGQILEFAGAAPPVVGEIVGVSVAIVILLIAFGSVVAAGLPIITALVGLVGGLSFVTFARTSSTSPPSRRPSRR